MALTRTDSMAAAAAVIFLGLLAGESALAPERAARKLDSNLPRAPEGCGDRNEHPVPLPAFDSTYYVGTMGPPAVLIAVERTLQSNTERENR